MEFILKDNPFAIKRTELSATILDPYWLRKYDPTGDPRLFWSLEVWAEGEMGDVEVEARATAQELRFPVRRWTDVVGQTVEWAGPYDQKVGGPYGNFYLGEHESIGRARLRFTERDGVHFRFEWEGLCDVFWDEEYGRDVPFSTAGWARFTGVTVHGSGADTDETLRRRLAEYIDPRDFVQGPLLGEGHRYDSGVKVARAVFIPLAASAA